MFKTNTWFLLPFGVLVLLWGVFVLGDVVPKKTFEVNMALTMLPVGTSCILIGLFSEQRSKYYGKAVKIEDIPKQVTCRVINDLGEESSFIIVKNWRGKDEKKDYRIIQIENPKNFPLGMEFKRSRKFKVKDFAFLDKSRFILDRDVLFEITSTAEQTVARVATAAER